MSDLKITSLIINILAVKPKEGEVIGRGYTVSVAETRESEEYQERAGAFRTAEFETFGDAREAVANFVTATATYEESDLSSPDDDVDDLDDEVDDDDDDDDFDYDEIEISTDPSY